MLLKQFSPCGLKMCAFFGAGGGNQQTLQLLLAELKRIELQQVRLKDAVTNNQLIIVHPRTPDNRSHLIEEDSDEDEATPKPAEDKIVASGGLTGFAVASDLLKMDFSPPAEVPEMFRAPAFNQPASPMTGKQQAAQKH